MRDDAVAINMRPCVQPATTAAVGEHPLLFTVYFVETLHIDSSRSDTGRSFHVSGAAVTKLASPAFASCSSWRAAGRRRSRRRHGLSLQSVSVEALDRASVVGRQRERTLGGSSNDDYGSTSTEINLLESAGGDSTPAVATTSPASDRQRYSGRLQNREHIVVLSNLVINCSVSTDIIWAPRRTPLLRIINSSLDVSSAVVVDVSQRELRQILEETMGGDDTEDPFISTDAVLDPAVDGKGSFSTNKNRPHSADSPKWLKRDACGYTKVALSIFAHFGLLVCLLAAIWMLIQHKSLDETFLLIPAFSAIAFYVTILLEANTCETHGALRRLDLSQSAENYIEAVRKAAPLVQWTAHAYHYDHEDGLLDGRTGDNKRRRCPAGLHRLTTRGRHRRTVSFRQNRIFQFATWQDATVNMAGVFLTPVIRMECSKVFIFKDDDSRCVYMQQYAKFRDDNRSRDELMDHTECLIISGFRERLTLYRDVSQRLWWMTPSWFWLSTLMLLTWPYRWLFTRRSCSVYVIFVKELDVAS
ncbi:hypothetical protein LSAT2_027891 [Lamellibrachia satsuma]|nr:hypothetical protein LSAT2_027891 [Lamellibrachia satsuma]